MNKLLDTIIRHNVLSNVVLLIFLFAGIVGATRMVREFFPQFSVDRVQVRVLYPGADPEEVEEAISIKIEEAVESIEGIKKTELISNENMSVAIIEVKKGYDVGEVGEKVRNEVDAISTFPLDAEKPIVEEIAFRNEVLMIALAGELSPRILKEWAEEIKDELLMEPGISQVDVFGTGEYEINIELSEERLREYGLSLSQVAGIVRQSSLNLAGGTLRTKGEEIRIRTMGRKYTGEDFAKIVLLARPGGERVTLGRVATIRDDFSEDRIMADFNGKPSVIIGVFKTPQEDAIAISGRVREFVARKSAALPDGLEMTVWSDTSKLINDRINLLLTNGAMGLSLVFIMLWLFLDLRLSIWVAMGIPTSVAGTLFLMWIIGATINMISLFGLIMVLGIVVDDAIVVGEAIYVHRKRGDAPLEAAINGVKEVGIPVLGAVTTTIIAFIPLMFVSGIMGKFIAIMPVVVISALSISLVESLFILPIHLNHLPELREELRPHNPFVHFMRAIRETFGMGLERFVERVYSPFIRRVLRWRYVATATTLAFSLLVLGLLQGGFVKFTIFSDIDGNDLIAAVEFPVGTPVEVTKAAVDETARAFERVAAKVQTKSGEPLIVNAYAVAGESGMGFDKRSGSFRGMVRYEILDTEARDIYFKDLNALWAEEVGTIPGALEQTFAGIETGPPGSAINIWLLGDDMEPLRQAAEALKGELAQYDGVYQISDSFRPGKNEIQLKLKPEAHTLGLTVLDLATQVNASYYGFEALRQQRGRDDVRVKVRYTEDERARVTSFDRLRIRTRAGHEVPLSSVAEIAYGQGLASIVRADGQRLLVVNAEVDSRRANAEEILAKVGQSFLATLSERFPGVHYRFEGGKQDSRDAMASLQVGFPLALIGIFVIIATIFRSYIQPLIIMITVPLGIVGAILGHWVMGYEVTMLSMFGIVALAGIVVNDAIVLIERVNENLAEGMEFFESLATAGSRRFRAIFLTTLSTVGGLSPLILERNLQAQFLIPMALSIAAGVAFATVLTLVLIPCLLGILNDFRLLGHKALTGQWPTREEVEPSSARSNGREGGVLPLPEALPAGK